MKKPFSRKDSSACQGYMVAFAFTVICRIESGQFFAAHSFECADDIHHSNVKKFADNSADADTSCGFLLECGFDEYAAR
jgi:hypothetical protein